MQNASTPRRVHPCGAGYPGDGWESRSVFGSGQPNIARMYDYCLGGKDHLAADREAVAQLASVFPDVGRVAVANRGFVIRAVRHLAHCGISQFVDLGSGIPAAPNVHEVARAAQPGARVVYLDHDPVVTAHLRARCAVERVAVVEGDLTDPAAVLGDPQLRRTIDLDEPVGLILGAVLHFVAVDTANDVMAGYRDALPAGSQIAASVLCGDGFTLAEVERIGAVYARAGATLVPRSLDQAARLFDGLALAEPGLVGVDRWRHGGASGVVRMAAGVGRV